jgi:DNA invertase Pin-like site-specific DNA recombinase
MGISKKNVIELLRVSTDHQDVARQRAENDYVKQKYGLHVVRTLELIGVSGTATLDDAQVQQVLADLASPGVDGILISSMDRLFRPKEYRHFSILDRFTKEGKKIWSAREGEVDPASDEGYDKCITAGGRAGAEWRDLRRRSAGGRRRKLEAGKLDHGTPKYGYVYIRKWHPGGQRFELDTAMALPNLSKVDVVRMVFQWRRSGMTPYTAAARLNEMGILSAGTNGKPSGLWSRQTVRQMLTSTTYIGQHKRGGVIVPCPRIIDDELFYAVQASMDASRNQHVGRPSKIFLLRGFLWCGKCGRRCVGNRKAKQARLNRSATYRCGNISNKPPQKRLCDASQVPRDKIESAAWGTIWRMLKTPQLLLEMGRAHLARLEKRSNHGGAVDLERELVRLRAKLNTTRDMTQEGLLPYAKGRADIRECERRIKEIEQELAAAGRVLQLPPLRATEAALREITGGAEPETYDERRRILEGILDLRMTYLDGDLTIEGKVPIAGAALLSGSTKNCNSRLDADAEPQRCHHYQAEQRRPRQAAERETYTSHEQASPLAD